MKSCWPMRFFVPALLSIAIVGFIIVPPAKADQIACFSMDTDPGWTAEGLWQFGIPAGRGSDCADPVGGYTGGNVYGYNLDGDYSDEMPEYHLTTTAINCSGYENVTVAFWRRLGIETSSFDHAKVEVSNDASNWITLWEHFGSSFCESEWTEDAYDISAVADNQPTVYIRWAMGPTDSSATYPGWNIDDVCLVGDLMDDMQVTPSEAFQSSGEQGGPFAPTEKTYTLANTGDSPVAWTVTVTAPWLNAEPASGTLLPSESVLVTVSLTAQANTLEPDEYDDLITFTNITSGSILTQEAHLQVNPIPGEIEVTDSIGAADDLDMPFEDIILSLSRTEHVTITNTDPAHELIVTDIVPARPYAPQTSELSIVLPAVKGCSSGPGNTYLPAGWAAPKKPESKLVISAGYKALNYPMNVLLLATGGEPTILRTGLAVFPDIGTVDFFECSAGVPTLAYLSAYDVVVVMSNAYFYDAVQTGNVLADYVDGGGKVIEAVASFATGAGWELAGRFVTGDYEPFNHGAIEFFYHNLGDFDQTHPVMAGVTSLTNIPPVGVSLKPQADWVANWDNGTALVATRNNNVVGINIFPFDGTFTGDVVLLFHNSAAWLVRHGVVGFTLTDVPSLPVTIPPAGNITFDIVFKPTETREYQAHVVIESIDRDESSTEVALSGTGIPDYMEVTPATNFTFSGHPGGPFMPSTTSYQLTNSSEVPVAWAVESDVPWLSVLPSSGALAPGASTQVVVSPNSAADGLPEGSHPSGIIFTNVTTTISHKRNIVTKVYTSAKIRVQPSGIAITVLQGESETATLNIENTGDGTLNYLLSGQQTGFAPWHRPSSASALAAESIDLSVGIPESHDFNVPADVPFAEDRIIVRFKPKAGGKHRDQKYKQQVLDSFGGGQIKRNFKFHPGLSVVKLPQGLSVRDALKTFNRRTQDILYAEPDYQRTLSSKVPNDTYFTNLWAMHNTGQSGGVADADIDAPEAWDLRTDSSNIIVAVIDTGVDYTHPDLAANIWVNTAEQSGIAGVDDDNNGYIDDIHGYDFYNTDGNPMDDHGHGTHVSGIIGAVGNNGQGVAGVCWKAKIMALKFLGSSGSGYDSDAIDCIEYAVQMGAKITSNSWGGGDYGQALKDAIDAAGAAGVLFVAAAGNDYGNNNDINPAYPASYDCANIIAVLSTDSYDAISGFSNYGLTSVDLGAPGSSIYSCFPGGQYGYLNGTSMATPHVSGACALVWSANPYLSSSAVKDIILETTYPLPALAGLCVTGGRLNLFNVMKEAVIPWMEFDPVGGAVAARGSQNVLVTFYADCPAGTYEGQIVISSNDPFCPQVSIPVTMTVEPIDYLTELFDANDPNQNDLAYKTLVFSPCGNSCYSLCVRDVNDLPVDPSRGTVVSLGDDDYAAITLPEGEIPFFGELYDTFYIGSNGYISFLSGDVRFMESLEDHFDLPRISALFDDFDPTAGGRISYALFDDGVVVTFEDIAEYGSSETNTFQIEMRFGGKIIITFMGVAAQDGLAGLSDGGGVPEFFETCDLSEYSTCDFGGDITGDEVANFIDFAVFAHCEQEQYEYLTTESVLDMFDVASYGNNDGTLDWAGVWQEYGESDGPTKGIVRVARSNGYLQMNPPPNGAMVAYGIIREADLANTTAAVLTFDYIVQNKTGSALVQISADGGSTWQTLGTYDQSSGTGSTSFDVAAYASEHALLKFELSEGSRMYIRLDNIQIEYDLLQLSPECAGCNLDKTGMIDFWDLAVLADHWLE